MPQSVIHEMLYMKHPTRLKILQGVFLCSNLSVTSPETGAENFFSPAIGSSDQTKAADGGASPRQVPFLCKGKQAVQALRRKVPDSGKCANGVQKVCSRFPT